MNFGGISESSSSSCDPPGGVKMGAADGSVFTSQLSLAYLPKIEEEMGFIGETHSSSVIKGGKGGIVDEFDGVDRVKNAKGHDSSKKSSKEKYSRHKSFQIQDLEDYFKKNPHPDEKGRLELSKRLGLESRQVKFWFQNRRTQLKMQLERHENIVLKQENEKLCHDNIVLCDAMRNPICERCGSQAVLHEVPPEQLHLRIENARLKDELDRLGVVVSKFLNGCSDGSMAPYGSKLDLGVGGNEFCGMNTRDLMYPLGLELGNGISEANVGIPVDKTVFLQLGMAAMEELMKLAHVAVPVWLKKSDENIEFLNLEEYAKAFTPCIGMNRNHFTTEATRATGTAFISSMALVEALMDANHWTELFPRNIGRASVDVICSGMPGNQDTMLLLVQAEFQTLSPLVPVRLVKFIRFCKHHGDGLWAVVDVSVDELLHGLHGNCRRLPSGCVVQDLPNGYSKVTWIEHTEYDESAVHHLFRSLVRSGKALGAQKWLHDLQTQCELPITIMSPGSDPSGSTLFFSKLARRMTRGFCAGICATVHQWETVQIGDYMTLMIRKSTGVNGEPLGMILSAATTVCLPVPAPRLLDFLRDEKSRVHWDALSEDGAVQQMHIFNSKSNSISLLQAKVPGSDTNRGSVLVLQETCTDVSGSLVVYAPIDASSMNSAMNGGDPSTVPILPSGFSIMADGSVEQDGNSLLTLGFQMLVNHIEPEARITMESVETVKSLMARRIHGVKTGLGLAGD